MSCIDPNPWTGNAGQRSARPAFWEAEEERRAAEAARLEVELLARSIAHDAYYADHDPAPGVILVPDDDRPLSPEAARRAHGFIYARVKTHMYRPTHAWVCLDCRWVGSFPEDGIGTLEQTAERGAHACPNGVSE